MRLCRDSVQAVVLTDGGSSATLNIRVMINSRERREIVECKDQKDVGQSYHFEQTHLIPLRILWDRLRVSRHGCHVADFQQAVTNIKYLCYSAVAQPTGKLIIHFC